MGSLLKPGETADSIMRDFIQLCDKCCKKRRSPKENYCAGCLNEIGSERISNMVEGKPAQRLNTKES